MRDLLDWLTVALAPIAVVGVLNWAGAGRGVVALAIALVALLTIGAALLLRRRAPARGRLRVAEESLAAALTAIASAVLFSLPAPNWSLVDGAGLCRPRQS